MNPAERHAISIEEVEREIAAGTRRLMFSPAVEAEFERTSADRRSRVLINAGVVAVILYDLFLISDWVTLHDRFSDLVIARLGIFTPITIAMLFISYRYKPKMNIQESFAIVSAVIAVILPMSVMINSNSDYRLNYQYGSLLVMMFCTITQRLSFRMAAIGLFCMLSVQLAAAYISGAFDAETYVGIVLFFVTACVLMAITNYFLEHGERQSFLFALRGELLRDQIEAGARIDPLTGLFNRRHLAERQAEIWDPGAKPQTVSAILLDIDHFKAFNDSRGHLEGDDCLRSVSGCISSVARDRQGLAFRFGGEEILVLMPGRGLDEAMQAGEAMRVAIEAAAIPHDAIGGVVTASIGVAACVAPESKAAVLIAAADSALYAAKGAGRNRVSRAISRDHSVFSEPQATAA